MHYEEAVKEWGARHLEAARPGVEVERESVNVRFAFDPGYDCCGGSDPDCYCSFAQSPRAEVEISGITPSGAGVYTSIDVESFDFATVLKELLGVSDGTLTN